MIRKILFLTGTRADYGKLKSLMKIVEQRSGFECFIFATGMHTLSKYGYTVEEITKEGFSHIHVFNNQFHGEPMDIVLANTVGGLSRYVHELHPDLIVVHGDRVEAMAGAIVGSLNNILVAHIEGGELSGTIDGLIRHAISKMSHLHFVANQEAADRLIQLGETRKSIFVIGSPDIDVMLSESLPSIKDVKKRYEIPFQHYGVALFHPVTTELDSIREQADHFVDALIKSGRQYIVIYPNNDAGSELILQSYKKLEGNNCFKVYPSVRFEYFLTLLKNCDFIIGNSSAGVREAPVYGVYSIDLGTRQNQRFKYDTIFHAELQKTDIVELIDLVMAKDKGVPSLTFGVGTSDVLFMSALEGGHIWETNKQKEFQDLKGKE